jgi:uncharacterized protein YndB with AHSA1/START domain
MRFFEHRNSTTHSPLVEVEMMVDAEAAEIFRAWSESDRLREWWGPEGFSAPVARLNFKVGGKYLIFFRSDDGERQIWSTGEYLAIDPEHRILCSDLPSNSEGEVVKPAQGPFADVGESFITLELEPVRDNQTLVSLFHEGLPARIHDDCVEGWTSSLRKLKRLVEKKSSAAA